MSDATQSPVPESEEGDRIPDRIVVLGKIGAPYGVRGSVRIVPYADDPQEWSKLPHWWLGCDEAAPGQWRQTRLIQCRTHQDALIAQFEGVTDRTIAEELREMLIGVPRFLLPATERDEYYWGDLIGLEVRNQQEQSLGRIVGLIETPANSVLRVRDGDSAERLLPFVSAIVLDVDLRKERVTVAWELDW